MTLETPYPFSRGLFLDVDFHFFDFIVAHGDYLTILQNGRSFCKNRLKKTIFLIIKPGSAIGNASLEVSAGFAPSGGHSLVTHEGSSS